MIYRVGKDELNLFVILARFSSLLLDTIPQHPTFKTCTKSKERYKKLKSPLNRAMSELEALKTILDDRDRVAAQHAPRKVETKIPKAKISPQSNLPDLSISVKGVSGEEEAPAEVDRVTGQLDLMSASDQDLRTAAMAKGPGGGEGQVEKLPATGSSGKHSFLPGTENILPDGKASTSVSSSGSVAYPEVSAVANLVPEIPHAAVPSEPLAPPQVPPPQASASAPEMVQGYQGPPVDTTRNIQHSAGAMPFAGGYACQSSESWEEPQRIDHTPRVVSSHPTEEAAKLDYMNLSDRLKVYGLVEKKVRGDGNCQFRSLSDQLFGTPERFVEVRRMVCSQLKGNRELYEPYVPEDYEKYMLTMSKDGEWGDHVTLQAAADVYGRRICVLSSYKESFIIDIQPQKALHPRVLWLSFWAEVHYNSVYPQGSL